MAGEEQGYDPEEVGESVPEIKGQRKFFSEEASVIGGCLFSLIIWLQKVWERI